MLSTTGTEALAQVVAIERVDLLRIPRDMDSERHNCNANIAFRDAFTGNELLVAGYYSDTWSWGPAAAYDLRYDGPLRRLGWQSRCPLWPPPRAKQSRCLCQSRDLLNRAAVLLNCPD